MQTEGSTSWQLVERRESNPKERIEMPEHTKSGTRLSRRDFARVAAVTAATAALPVTNKAAGEPQPAEILESNQAAQLPPSAEAHYQAILAKYGKRLSDEQKTELKRLITQAQKTSEALGAFPLENSNEPAMIFHVYRKS